MRVTSIIALAFGLCVVSASAQAPIKSIRLRNETILTPPGQAQAVRPHPAPQASPAAPLTTTLYLVQFEDRVQPAWRTQLRGMKVQLLRYVPEDTFIVRMDPSLFEDVQALPFVRWLDAYRADHKVHHLIQERAATGAGKEPFPVSVLIMPGANPGEVAGARRQLQTVRSEAPSRFGTVLRGNLAPGQVAQLAQSSVVLWIEPGPSFQLYDETASDIVGGEGTLGQTAIQDLGYDGTGTSIAVADSGLDSGEINSLHPDLAGRVSALFFYGTLTDASDEHSHGTHVAGIVAGNGAIGETDENGALYGLGVASGANIVGQRIFDAEGGYEAPATHEELTRDAVRAGADIGSNSWGDDTQGRYDISAMEFDALVRDADASTPGDQAYILEFSAGNSGPGPQSIGSPAVAKNVIASGASQNNRANLPVPEFTSYDTGQETMAGFSSRGPCEDGRIKPDVVAPGTWIASLRSVFANDDFAWSPISDNYMYQGGTSQSGPHVSGAAAVFVHYWRDTHAGQTPSPALVKAALINSAVDMDNLAETGPVPNMDEGWGRVDLTRLIGTSRGFEFVDQEVLLQTGQTSETRVLIDNLEEPLKITLVYTDVPGFPGAIPALVNDLDLEVIGPDGAVYRGNAFNLGESIPNAPAADRVNNVEAVHIQTPLAGEYIIRVQAPNVVQDARVDTGEIDQDFALFVTGAIATPGSGIVALDRRFYTAPAQLTVKLFDQDLAGNPTASLLLRSTSESSGETITLQAVGGTGQFEAVVDIAQGAAATNGRLEVQHDDLIEAVYEDADPARTRIVKARADLVPPTISNVDAAFQFNRVLITYYTDEDTTSTIVYGLATPSLAVTNRSFESSHGVLITNVVAGETYLYSIIAEDRAGNRTTNDNGGTYFTFTPGEAPRVLLVDDYHRDIFSIPSLTGYTEPLNRLGVSYDVWDTSSDGQVTAGLLAGYRAAIWRVTEFSTSNTWSALNRQAVTNYLNQGGSLMIASMEFLSRLQEEGFTTFGQDALGVASFVEDTGAARATESPDDPIGNGIDVPLDYALYEDPTGIKELLTLSADASDSISPTTNASPILINGSDVIGVRSPRIGQDLPGRVVFLSIPLDAVPLGTGVGNNRTGLLGSILDFLAPRVDSSSLVLDREVYSAPGLVTIEVSDLDQADQGTLTVHAFSSEDTNGVTAALTQTTRRGLFRGTLPLALTNNPGGASGLLVQGDGTFDVTYDDVSESEILMVSGIIDIVPPQISTVTAEPSFVSATLSWETSEAATTLVQFSDSPGNPLVNFTAYDPATRLNHELTLEELKPEHTYYFTVISQDRAGNTTTDDNGGQLYRFTTATPIVAPWADSLENGSDDWDVFTTEGSEVEWSLGQPGNGVPAVSPVNAWGSNLDGGPAGVSESFLISPTIFLPVGNQASLRFMQNYDFTLQGAFDILEYGEVILILDGRSSISLGSFVDISSGWEQAEFDLTPYQGKVVNIAFHYTLLSLGNSPRLGWLVDDISVNISGSTFGTIQITNNLWQASFELNGPISQAGQGATLVLPDAPPGEYRITYGEVRDYIAPLPQTNTLDALGTLLFEGHYTFLDINTNGISDSWEERFGGVDTNRTVLTDTDGDGATDVEEFNAGTDPTQTNSILHVTAPVALPAGQVELTWPTVAGRAYRVGETTNSIDWTPVFDWMQSTNASMSFTPPLQPGPLYLYRVEVSP